MCMAKDVYSGNMSIKHLWESNGKRRGALIKHVFFYVHGWVHVHHLLEEIGGRDGTKIHYGKKASWQRQKTSFIQEGFTSQTSATDGLVPDNTAYLLRSIEFTALKGQCCFGGKKINKYTE